MAGSAKHTQRTALVQLSQYNGDEHIFSGGMTGGVLTYDAASGTGWSWRDALGLNAATPSAAGTLLMQMSANGLTGITIRRFTDTGPTGNYWACLNTSGGSLCHVDAGGGLFATNLYAPVTNLTGTLAVSQGGTGDTGTPWTSYTPSLSASSGTLTSASASGRYKTLGKTVWVQLRVDITTNGTAAGILMATLPLTAATYCHLAGREHNVTGNALIGTVATGTSSVSISTYNNLYPGGNGTTIIASGVYEAS